MVKFAALFLVGAAVWAQPWSTFIDPSRAINWSSSNVGFTIPSYSVNCSTQPSLLTGSGNAGANTTAIQAALASCDATHNVVNIAAGTFYFAGLTYGSQGKQVLRGAGPNSTILIATAEASCVGISHGVCMIDASPAYDGSASILPGGAQQCLWSAGYAKGATSITLSSCGGAPPLNQTIILDQANDMSDTGGVFICDANMTGCTTEAGDFDGRVISGVTHSLQQVVYTTAVTSLGGGSYTVTISPGIHSNSIRSGQSPGAWWPGFVQNDGIENMTLDGSAIPDGTLSMFDCYQCWAKNMRFLDGGRNDILVMQSAQDVVRDSYFYGAQGSGSQSYGVEFEISSGALVENNIFQQTTIPIMFGQGTGHVIDYNYAINSNYAGSSFQAPYYGHSGGNQMVLWEGNNFLGIWTDDVHGTTATGTFFRNMLQGWQTGKTDYTFPVALRAFHRVNNVVGNVIGQPGYHNLYESYATSSSAGVNGGGAASESIYELGWSDNSGIAVCNAPVACDPLSRSTLLRWGNYDTVTAGVKWDSTEASPAAVTYANANFTSTYFGSLAHTLPASLFYASMPSWWPSGKAWPPVGPDVSAGNLGICTGTYAGAQATSAGQCTGGTLTSAWAAHAVSIPAEDCFLTTMSGPADGSGSALAFDAGTCYAPPAPPLPIFWITRSGQSLSVGSIGYCNSAGYPTCSTGAAYGNLTIFNTGATPLDLYPAGDTQFRTLAGHVYQNSSPAIESSATSMCNQYSVESGRICGTTDYGWPGSAFPPLAKGASSCTSPATCYFANSIGNGPQIPGTASTDTGVIQAKALALAQGSPFYAPGVYFNQGENEMDGATTAATYESYMVQLQSDYNTSINAAIGQTGLIPLFLVQKSSWATYTGSGGRSATPTGSGGNDTSPTGQLQSCLDHYADGTIFCVGPDYTTNYVGDGTHKFAPSYRAHGGREGFALDWVTRQHRGWRPFYPKGVTLATNIITVQEWVPPTETGAAGTLVVDTTNIAALADGNYGFEFTDTASTCTGSPFICVTLPSNSAALKAGTTDSLTLTLSGTPAGTFELRYAWTSPNGACPGVSGGAAACAQDTSVTPFTPSGSAQAITLVKSTDGYTVGQKLLISETSNSANFVYAQVNTFSGSALNFTGISFGGDGLSHSDWSVSAALAYTGPLHGARGNLSNGGSTTGSWFGDTLRHYAFSFRIPGISAAAPYTWAPAEPTNLGTIPGPPTVTTTPIIAFTGACSITAAPGTSITCPAGNNAILDWTVTGATSVSIDNSIGTVAATGTTIVQPFNVSSVTYTLTAVNSSGTVTATVTVALDDDYARVSLWSNIVRAYPFEAAIPCFPAGGLGFDPIHIQSSANDGGDGDCTTMGQDGAKAVSGVSSYKMTIPGLAGEDPNGTLQINLSADGSTTFSPTTNPEVFIQWRQYFDPPYIQNVVLDGGSCNGNITLTGVTGTFTVSETVTSSGVQTKGTVVSWTPGTGVLILAQLGGGGTEAKWRVGTTVTGGTSGAVGTILTNNGGGLTTADCPGDSYATGSKYFMLDPADTPPIPATTAIQVASNCVENHMVGTMPNQKQYLSTYLGCNQLGGEFAYEGFEPRYFTGSSPSTMLQSGVPCVINPATGTPVAPPCVLITPGVWLTIEYHIKLGSWYLMAQPGFPTATATFSGGNLTAINFTDPGSNWTPGTTITLNNAGGVNAWWIAVQSNSMSSSFDTASADCVVDNYGQIHSCTVTNAGSGHYATGTFPIRWPMHWGNNFHRDSTIERWQALPGQPSVLVETMPYHDVQNSNVQPQDWLGQLPQVAWHTAPGSYGKIWFLGYSTGRDPWSGPYPDAHAWIDNLLVSTKHVPDPGVLVQPVTNLAIVKSSYPSVTLSWEKNLNSLSAYGESGYDIERCPNQIYNCIAGSANVTGAVWTTVSANLNALTYTETIPDVTKVFTYRVRAVNASTNNSDWSNPVTTAIHPPSDLTAAWNIANSAVVLTWQQMDEAGTFAVERCGGVFQFRKTNASNGMAFDNPNCMTIGSNTTGSLPTATIPFAQIASGITGTSKGATITWTDSTASSGTLYTYRVRSYAGTAPSWVNWNTNSGLYSAYTANVMPWQSINLLFPGSIFGGFLGGGIIH